MEQENVIQTTFDQLVSDEGSQMMKAVIPYLSFSGQRVLSTYAKMQELRNTIQLFSRSPKDMQICSSQSSDPVGMLNDIRKFSYGESRKRLDQAVNMIAMIQLMQTVNEE